MHAIPVQYKLTFTFVWMKGGDQSGDVGPRGRRSCLQLIGRRGWSSPVDPAAGVSRQSAGVCWKSAAVPLWQGAARVLWTYVVSNSIFSVRGMQTELSSVNIPFLFHFHQCLGHCFTASFNWRAPWKNQISSTSMKLRKSLVKPVMRQNISSCSVLSPEIVMHDAFNVVLWTSADICVVMQDDLRWKNRTTRMVIGFGELAAVD